jgi:hypothetical protein
MSQYNILQSKLNIVNKKLNERIAYVEKHCISNKSMACKQKWIEIRELHKMAILLQKQIKRPELIKQELIKGYKQKQ